MIVRYAGYTHMLGCKMIIEPRSLVSSLKNVFVSLHYKLKNPAILNTDIFKLSFSVNHKLFSDEAIFGTHFEYSDSSNTALRGN